MTITNFQHGVSSFGSMVQPMYGAGIGNIYYVCQQANSAVYADVKKKFAKHTYHGDGSNMLHTTIASALSMGVSNREDYFIVCSDSSDYDCLTTNTMAARNSHLICPGGMGSNGMGMNSARVHSTGDVPAFTLTADCTELAGFFIKGYVNTAANVLVSGTRWHVNIHDMFVGMSATSAGTANYGIYGSQANHASVHHNFVCNYSPGAVTGTNNAIAALIYLNGTRGIVADNICLTGANTTVTSGMTIPLQNAVIARNYVMESCAISGGVADAGTLTSGITGANSVMIDNRIGVVANATSAVIGGTADLSFIHNFASSDGGTQCN